MRFILIVFSSLFILNIQNLATLSAEKDEDRTIFVADSWLPMTKKVIVEGSTAFSPEELALITVEYLGKPLNLATIQEIARAIAEFYWDKGFLTSDAYPVRDQDISQGIVRIKVVEGELESVEIEGAKNLAPSWLSHWLRQKAGTPLNVNNVLEALQLIQQRPDIETVRADLQRGSQSHQSILKVVVAEKPNFNLQAGADNYGAFSSGQEEGLVNFSVNSVSGKGDALSSQVWVSEGSQQWVLNYQLPVCFIDCSLRLHYEGGNSRIIRQPLERFDIQGDYQQAFIEWSQPIVNQPSRQIFASVEAGWQQSQTFVLGRRFSFSPQIPDGNYDAYTVRLSTTWKENWTTGALAIRGEATLGWDSLKATTDPFLILRGQANWVERLNESLLVSLSGSFQIAGSSLGGSIISTLPSEQFPIGGFTSVPGYDLYLRRGDNGVNLRLDFYQTLLNSPDFGTLTLAPFTAIGSVWNKQLEIPYPATLASVGANLEWALNGWEVNLGVGVPLINVPDGFQQTTYFSVRKRISF